MPQQDIQSILDPLKINKELKAQAWDAFQQSTDQDDLVKRLTSVGIPKETKAALWDLKGSSFKAPVIPQEQQPLSDEERQTGPGRAGELSLDLATGPFQALAGLPDAVKQVVATAMSKDPNAAVDQFINAAKGIGRPVVTALRNVSSYNQALHPDLAPFMAVKSISPPTMQENKEAAATAGTAIAGLALGAGKEQLPSKLRAGANLNRIEAAAGDVPINPAAMDAIASRYGQFTETGDSTVKMMENYMNRREDPIRGPITYEEGRRFAEKAGDLSQEEKNVSSKRMKAQITKFSIALKDANREAAASVGMGELYDQAIKEYRQASNIADKAAIIKKWTIPAIIGIGGIGKAGQLIRDLLTK